MSSRVVPTVLLLIVVLPVTFGTVAMDYLTLSTAVLQVRSASWPSVLGTITQSEVETVRSNKSTSYRMKLAYTYSVDGQPYEGVKRRLSTWGSGDLEDVEARVTRYPVGASIPVYYRPSQPSEAILEPGLGNSELFLLMLMLPLNLGALCAVALVVRIWLPKPPPLSTFFWEDGSECVRLTGLETTVWVLLALGGSAVACCVLGGVAGAYEGPLAVGIGAWGVIIACGVLTRRMSHARRESGRYDLRLHSQARSLSLPAISGRKRRLDLRWSDVRSIRVEPPVRGNQRGSEDQYPLTVEHVTADGELRQETVTHFNRKERAEALAHWLRTHLQVGEAAPKRARSSGPRIQAES